MGAPERVNKVNKVNKVVYALIFSGFDILCTRLNSSKKIHCRWHSKYIVE
jgi:hypothetical protein